MLLTVFRIRRKKDNRQKANSPFAITADLSSEKKHSDWFRSDPHLPPWFATTILPALLEASVPVRPDDAVVQPCAVDEAHGVFCICARVVSSTAES